MVLGLGFAIVTTLPDRGKLALQIREHGALGNIVTWHLHWCGPGACAEARNTAQEISVSFGKKDLQKAL